MNITDLKMTKIENYCRNIMNSNASNGHGFDHVKRVEALALKIAENTSANIDIKRLQLIALMHDLDDKKLSPHTYAHKTNARGCMCLFKIPEKEAIEIIEDLKCISFSDHKEARNIETMCVQDADRIDSLGVVGFVRACEYGATHNNTFFDPNKKYKSDIWTDNEGADPNTAETTIDFQIRKSYQVVKSMNTDYGKQLAKQRYRDMRTVIDAYLKELIN